jgi:hypothetical protein
MTARVIISILLYACSIPACGQAVSDMGIAREWCDRTMTHRIEGIWEFPQDETRVLIRRSAGTDNRYDIIVVESPDTRLQPGENIGYLQISPLSTKFEMALYRNRQKGILGSPGKCLAELNEKEDALIIQGRKMKFSLGSRWFLPAFWRSVRISLKNPLNALPKGMIRIYPKTTRRQPDYL